MNKIEIFLADHHHLVRQSLRTLLELEPDFVIVGEAGDGFEAVVKIDRLQPNVLVIDLMLPGLKGLEVIRQVHRHCPQTGILVLSMYADEVYVRMALKHGALGYILKDEEVATLLQAIRLVAAGQLCLSPRLAGPAAEKPVQSSESLPPDPYETLTLREREILHLVTEGLSSSQIATRLSISPRTVEHHRSHLMRKLSVQSRAELIQYALRRGIVR